MLSKFLSPKIFSFLLLALIIFKLFSFPVASSLADQTSDSLDALQQKRLEYENKIKELQTKEKTFKNEISLMENRINSTIIKIREAEVEIKIREEELGRLTGDIGLVSGKIDLLGKTLDSQKSVFSARVASAYKSGRESYLEMFLGSRDFSYFVNRLKYLRTFEQNDNRYLRQMEDTRRVFQSQKIILADKKDQVEQIKRQIDSQRKNLESYKSQLGQQKKEKQNILSLTLNDEGKYQQLLTQILAEIESVAKSLHGGIKIGEVKKGDVIAREGNSGCVIPQPTKEKPTNGSHLHFGVYKDGVAVDPRPYLESEQLAWPEDSARVTQEFGENRDWYMRYFGIPGHNAMDMSHGYGTAIIASADGVAYETGDSRQYASWCNGKARGIRIEHPNGLITIYWHVL